MNGFYKGLFVGIVVATAVQVVYGGYQIRNQHVMTAQGSRSLTNDELAQGIIATQDDIDRLQSEIMQLKNDNQKLRRSMDEMDSSLSQFKNLYFRRF